jgi:D-arabinose 1-dehydrogenase-like Zn-dependent alcohol dehydrogenase
LGAGLHDSPAPGSEPGSVRDIGETPRYEPFPAPLAGDGEAVVTVTAAALKPSDRWMANGVHYVPTEFPMVVGLDGVGRLPDGARGLLRSAGAVRWHGPSRRSCAAACGSRSPTASTT